MPQVIVPKAETCRSVIPKSARQIMGALGQGTTRIVGGWVRDLCLGMPHGQELQERTSGADVDLATIHIPQETMNLLGAAGIRTIPVGLEHGTVGALMPEGVYEITTLRRDVRCDGRWAEVIFGTDWQEDAQRRDFTINAMSLDLAGVVHDYCGGLADLSAQRLRFIGDPQRRIQEDYLRILRYFRFVNTLGWEMDVATLAAIRANLGGLKQLSRERVRDELLKTLSQPHHLPSTLRAMANVGVFSAIGLGSLEHERGLEHLRWEVADPIFNLALVLKATDATNSKRSAISDDWRLSKAAGARVVRLLSLADELSDRLGRAKLAYKVGLSAFADGLQFMVAWGQISPDEAARFNMEVGFLSQGHCPISGREIMDLGYRGKEVGEIKARAEEIWLDSAGQLSTAEIIERLIERLDA